MKVVLKLRLLKNGQVLLIKHGRFLLFTHCYFDDLLNFFFFSNGKFEE